MSWYAEKTRNGHAVVTVDFTKPPEPTEQISVRSMGKSIENDPPFIKQNVT